MKNLFDENDDRHNMPRLYLIKPSIAISKVPSINLIKNRLVKHIVIKNVSMCP